MENKLTLSFFYVGLISAILGVLLTGMTFHRSFQAQMEANLEETGELISVAYDQQPTANTLADCASDALRITLVAPDGAVLYDSQVETEENHLSRPEIQQALSQGSGSVRRQSDTTGTDDYYYALLLSDGNVLRVSVQAASMFQVFSQSYPWLFAVVFFLIILATCLALVLTRSLLRPIKEMAGHMDDLTLAQDEKRCYPELAPVVRELQTQYMERAHMRQEFTANVTHELKTPLTSISGYAEMIETGLAKPQDVTHFAATIRKEAGRMLTLISDIIRLSELDESTQPAQHQPVELHQLAQDCADSLSLSAAKHGIRLFVNGGPTEVMGNKDQLWELVYNLCDNAIRYNRPNGSVTIITGSKCITVSDTGIGIPKEHQGRIFERFYRVDKSHSRATGGTGLGLSIVKHIAEQHHAKIALTSMEGVGTQITVTFPE